VRQAPWGTANFSAWVYTIRVYTIRAPSPRLLIGVVTVQAQSPQARLAPEELPEQNYVRRTVGALETRIASVGTSPPTSPRLLASSGASGSGSWKVRRQMCSQTVLLQLGSVL